MTAAEVDMVLRAQEDARQLTAEAFASHLRAMLRQGIPYSDIRRYIARLEAVNLAEVTCVETGVHFVMLGVEAQAGGLRAALTDWVARATGEVIF